MALIMYLITNLRSDGDLFVGRMKLRPGSSARVPEIHPEAWRLQKEGLLRIESIGKVGGTPESDPAEQAELKEQLDSIQGMLNKLVADGLPVQTITVAPTGSGKAEEISLSEVEGFSPSSLPKGDVEKKRVSFDEKSGEGGKAQSAIEKLKGMQKEETSDE